MEPRQVFVLDHADPADPRAVRSMNERVAACYAWADRRRVQVLDEFIVWTGPTFEPHRVRFALVRACRDHRAAVLVHSPHALDRVIAPVAGGPDPLPGVPVLTLPPVWALPPARRCVR